MIMMKVYKTDKQKQYVNPHTESVYPRAPCHVNSVSSLAQPDHYFSSRRLSIRDYKRLLEIGSGTLPIGQL